MVTTILFNILQGPYKYLKKYITYFNKMKIKVIHPNQDLFVGAFQNGPKEGYLNESLDLKANNFLGKGGDTCIMTYKQREKQHINVK